MFSVIITDHYITIRVISQSKWHLALELLKKIFRMIFHHWIYENMYVSIHPFSIPVILHRATGEPSTRQGTPWTEMPISLCVVLDWGGNWSTQRKPLKDSTHTGWRWESSPQPWGCEASVLTTTLTWFKVTRMRGAFFV